MGYEVHLSTRGVVGLHREGLECSCGNDEFVALPKAVIKMAPSDILSCTNCGNAYKDTEEHRLWRRGGTEETSEQVKVFVEGIHEEYTPAPA